MTNSDWRPRLFDVHFQAKKFMTVVLIFLGCIGLLIDVTGIASAVYGTKNMKPIMYKYAIFLGCVGSSLLLFTLIASVIILVRRYLTRAYTFIDDEIPRMYP